MTELRVKCYGLRDERVKFRFNDEAVLYLSSFTENPLFGGEPEITGIENVVLYQGGNLEAVLNVREKRGFWSRGTITQPQLAEYLGVVEKVGKQVQKWYEGYYFTKKDWKDQYWLIWRLSYEAEDAKERLRNESEKVLRTIPRSLLSQLRN